MHVKEANVVLSFDSDISGYDLHGPEVVTIEKISERSYSVKAKDCGISLLSFRSAGESGNVHQNGKQFIVAVSPKNDLTVHKTQHWHHGLTAE